MVFGVDTVDWGTKREAGVCWSVVCRISFLPCVWSRVIGCNLRPAIYGVLSVAKGAITYPLGSLLLGEQIQLLQLIG